MRITNVRLENIKSYREANIDLPSGTIAIRGSNGAGKSTLVEAIGFALFDALPYKQAQFVREGERIGSVTVTFTSALDDREYQAVRRCGGSSDWYIYDPDLHERVVEQRADVVAFLRQHLRIESDLALDTLFNDAIGVQQGTFTADFLQTPAVRKKKFDVLLQVEDYRTASTRLLDAHHYLELQQAEQRARIEALQRETAQLDDWRATLEAGHARERTITAQLADLQRTMDALEAERRKLTERQQEVTQKENAKNLAEAEHRAAAAHLQQTESQLTEAAEAVRICTESRPDHERFLATEQQLSKARAQEQERNRLREQRSEAARDLEGAKRDLQNARQHLAAAEQAKQELIRWEPLAVQQQALEDQRTAARQRVSRRDEIAGQQQRATREHATTQQDFARYEQQIAQLETFRPDAEALTERRQQLEQAQAVQATRETNRIRLAAVHDELRTKEEKRKTLAQRETKAAANLRKILAQQDVVDGFPALETEQRALDGKIRQVQVRIEQHRLSRQQSGVGNCPFLREPCLNIQKRGENSLITYFDRLIAEGERELAPLQEHAAALTAQMEHARTVQSYWDRRGEFEEKQREAAEDGAQLDRECARLTEEQQRLQQTLASGADARAIERLRADYQRSEDAKAQRTRLPDIQRSLRETSARRETLAADLARLTSELATLESAPDELCGIEAHLRELGDARAKVASRRAIAADRTRLAEQVKSHELAARRLDTTVAGIEKQLIPFAALDETLRQLEETRTRANDGHLRYLRHEQTAAQHGERKKAHAAAEQQAKTATAHFTRATRDHEEAQKKFDSARLVTVNERVDALRGEHGQLTGTLVALQQECAKLAREIARVEGLLTDLSAAQDELQTLDELDRMLQQFRDTIKEAGPNILKAQLHAISHEANRIFGEILGDRSSELSWESDYEIVVRRDGRERAFAQLSGGEQMSAALAVRLALLRRLSQLDIAFFDEPTQNMDGERRGNLAEQIRRVRGFDQLLVISHDDTFEQGLDGVIHLEKYNGQTRLAPGDLLVPA